jgi:hypothetical protein
VLEAVLGGKRGLRRGPEAVLSKIVDGELVYGELVYNDALTVTQVGA